VKTVTTYLLGGLVLMASISFMACCVKAGCALLRDLADLNLKHESDLITSGARAKTSN